VALSAEFARAWLVYQSQRHITPDATEEIKFDGYRAIAVKTDGRVNLFSRRRKSLDHHYPPIVAAPGGSDVLLECF
jgi:ATP-dependent DNA ligase